MLQRIQSVYILLSFVLGVVALSNPIGRLTHEGERIADVYNLWLTHVADQSHVWTPWVALFVVLLIATTITFLSIMLFTRRALQMRAIVLCMLILVGYYACLGVFVFTKVGELTFTPSPYAALPLVSIILDYLAFRGVLKDEMLVKSLDRLR